MHRVRVIAKYGKEVKCAKCGEAFVKGGYYWRTTCGANRYCDSCHEKLWLDSEFSDTECDEELRRLGYE